MDNKKSILFLIPSRLDGPSARYIKDLAKELYSFNFIPYLASMEKVSSVNLEGIEIKNFLISGTESKASFLSMLSELESNKFDYVFSVGSRVAIDLIAIRLKETGSKLLKQFEDDEETIFLNCNKGKSKKDYRRKLVDGFNSKLSFFEIFENYKPVKVVDPYLKGYTLSKLDGYTKIWGALSFDEENLMKGLKNFSLPPVVSKSKIQELAGKKSSITPSDNRYFLGGSIYSLVDAEIFLNAWCEYSHINGSAELIISRSRTSPVVLNYIEERIENLSNVQLVDLPTDEMYLDVLLSAKYVVSIGGGEFDKKRLPSRLVKSMQLGKVVIAPVVGFGKSLMDANAGHVCFYNDAGEWFKTLQNTQSSIGIDIENKAKSFAASNFDIENIAESFSTFLLSAENGVTSSTQLKNRAPSYTFDAAHCFKADSMSFAGTSTPFTRYTSCKRVRIRLFLRGKNLLVQSLNREDYNYQVEQFLLAIGSEHENENINAEDLFVDRYSPIKIGEFEITAPPYFKFISLALERALSEFQQLNTFQRSFVLEKITIIFRVFYAINTLIEKDLVERVFFHADMQSTEAMLCDLINKNTFGIDTFTLQHALYYKPKSQNDVNTVNTEVSPSKFSLLWDNEVAKAVLKNNPHKTVIEVPSFSSFNLKGFDIRNPKRELLVVLDGPNNNASNSEMLKCISEFALKNKIKRFYIKPHPYHTEKVLAEMTKGLSCSLISDIDRIYKKTVFLSSTLGYELFDFGFSVVQYQPASLSSSIGLISAHGLKVVTSEKELLDAVGDISPTREQRIKNDSKKLEELQHALIAENILD